MPASRHRNGEYTIVYESINRLGDPDMRQHTQQANQSQGLTELDSHGAAAAQCPYNTPHRPREGGWVRENEAAAVLVQVARNPKVYSYSSDEAESAASTTRVLVEWLSKVRNKGERLQVAFPLFSTLDRSLSRL